MSRRCQVLGKGRVQGNNVSHAHNKTRKTWEVNLHKKRIFDPEKGVWVKVKVSARGLRTISKRGMSEAIANLVPR